MVPLGQTYDSGCVLRNDLSFATARRRCTTGIGCLPAWRVLYAGSVLRRF